MLGLTLSPSPSVSGWSNAAVINRIKNSSRLRHEVLYRLRYALPPRFSRLTLKNLCTNLSLSCERERCVSSIQLKNTGDGHKAGARYLIHSHTAMQTLFPTCFFEEVSTNSSYGSITYVCFASRETLDKMSHTAFSNLS